MQAIVTEYKAPTNVRGARILAKCDSRSITIAYPYEIDGEGERHRKAAEHLRDILGWNTEHYGQLVGGHLPGPGGKYAWVFTKG